MAKKNQQSDQESRVARQKEKAEAFKKLATARVSRALKVLSGIENLANKNSYAYDDAQVALINAALTAATKSIADAFARKDSKAAGGFSL